MIQNPVRANHLALNNQNGSQLIQENKSEFTNSYLQNGDKRDASILDQDVSENFDVNILEKQFSQAAGRRSTAK